MTNIPLNINDAVVSIDATANGQTVADFDFLAYGAYQLQATIVRPSGERIDLAPKVGFTVTGLGQANGGQITLLTHTLNLGDRLVIYRETPIERLTDYQPSGDFRAEDVNRDQDTDRMIMQELRRDLNRAAKVPMGAAAGEIVPGAPGSMAVWGAGGSLVSGPSADDIAVAVGFVEAAEYIKSLPRPGLVYSVRDFGVVGNGAVDDSANFQYAVNAVQNGVLWVPAGDYRINSIEIPYGLMLWCEDANGEVSPNANGQSQGKVRFFYNGPDNAAGFCFRWKAAAADTYLHGGGITGFPVFNGLTNGGYAVVASSTSRQNFELEGRNFRTSLIRLDSGNNRLSSFCRVDLKFTWGTAPKCAGCHGIMLTGETGDMGCTQHDIQTRGLFNNGNMVHIVGNVDNVRAVMHGARQSGGAGFVLAMYDGAVRHPRNNTFYDHAGRIYKSPNSFGNTLVRATSEGTEIVGPGQLHIAQLVDYINGKMYSTPTFPLWERRELVAGQAAVFGGATQAAHPSGLGVVITCADATVSGAMFAISGGRWQRGNITGFRIKFSAAAGVTTGDVWFRIRAKATAENSDFADTGFAVAGTKTVPTSAGWLGILEIPVVAGSPLPISADSMLSFAVERVGNATEDTAAGAIYIHAVEVDYAAFGPENSYTAPTAMPPFRPSI